MKTYIGIKVVQAEPAERPHPTPLDPLMQDLGYRVVYPDGYVSWSPKAVFDKAYLEVGAEVAEKLEGELRNYVLFGDIPRKTTGAMPIADENDGHCPELRRLEALRIACASPLYNTNDAAIVARAKAFEAFIAGDDSKPKPRAAGATVDFNEMLECTDGSLWAEAYFQSCECDITWRTHDELIEKLTRWFANAIEAGRANGYKEALFTDDVPVPEFAEVGEAPASIMSGVGERWVESAEQDDDKALPEPTTLPEFEQRNG